MKWLARFARWWLRRFDALETLRDKYQRSRKRNRQLAMLSLQTAEERVEAVRQLEEMCTMAHDLVVLSAEATSTIESAAADAGMIGLLRSRGRLNAKLIEIRKRWGLR